MGLAVDLDLVEGKAERYIEIAHKHSFYQTVLPTEEWHWGYVGKSFLVNPSETNLDKNGIAREMGYTDWDSMLTSIQRDYVKWKSSL